MQGEGYSLRDPRTLLRALLAREWRVIAPLAVDGVLVPTVLTSPEDLPRGLSDTQQPGTYRLESGGSQRWFDALTGLQSWKR